MLTTAGRNQLLAATLVTHLSLHSGFPGQTQANEISGGSPAYARKGVSWASPSGGSVASSNAQVFDVPALTDVNWIGYSSGVTGGTGYGCVPNGAAPQEFIVDPATDKVLLPAHGYSDTQKITFYGGTPPGGLTEGVTYFVRDSTTDDFKVAATSGGTAINITSQAAASCVVSKIVTESFGAQGTMTLAIGATTQAINN